MMALGTPCVMLARNRSWTSFAPLGDRCNHVAMGSDSGEIQRAVETILATIWTADDWDAAIRDPELIAFEPLDESQRADWQRRLDGDVNHGR
jgi:hypothetical protein